MNRTSAEHREEFWQHRLLSLPSQSKVIQKYVGAAGPRWDIVWGPVEGSTNQVLVIVVDPFLAAQYPELSGFLRMDAYDRCFARAPHRERRTHQMRDGTRYLWRSNCTLASSRCFESLTRTRR